MNSNVDKNIEVEMKKEEMILEDFSDLELGDFREGYEELKDIDDLWYFVKSASQGWLAGSWR